MDELVEKGGITPKQKLKVLEELTEVAEIAHLKRGKYLGQVLENVDFEKIRNFLKKYKVDLQIGKSKGLFKVEGYFYKSGKTVRLKPNEAALFITDGNTMKLVLRKNATIYELLHELMHFRHSQEIGLKAYYNMIKNEGIVRTERFVYDKIIEYKKHLNRKELEHANRYMNWNYNEFRITDNIGNPIKVELPFELKQLPNKRQGININRILELK